MHKIILIKVLLISLFLSGCQSTQLSEKISEESTPKYPEFIQSGQTLPLESIVDIDGRQVNLKDTNKQKLVILFASWCSDSNRALKALNESPLLENKNIELIAIAREEDKATVSAWRDKHAIKVPLAIDKDRSIYQRFAAGGIPRFITVTKDNLVIKMNLAEGENQLELIEWN